MIFSISTNVPMLKSCLLIVMVYNKPKNPSHQQVPNYSASKTFHPRPTTYLIGD